MNRFLFPFLLAISCGEGSPTGERLVHGDCTFERGSASLTINQNSGKAIINWESFSLAEGELVQFLQPDSSSALLNRVISRSSSEIYGQLQANGKIYLINQNGIVIGPTGKIQAASFIASTLHLEDALFLQDELRFSGNRGGKLLQQGMIAVEGSIFLLACEVVNEGLLSAPNGSVCLASGSEVYLIDSRDGGAVRISGVGSVANRGGIEAARAELRASAGNIYALAVNQEGIIDATGSVEVDGEIILQAESGLVLVSGEMSAEEGGKIHLLGDFVHLIGTAALSVSGEEGGGEILVGGDYRGLNPAIPNAKGIYVGPNVRLSADALDRGDGGKIIFWGTDANHYYGVTSAQGGPIGGNGGFVEISSHGLLVPQGHVTTFAPQGRTGTLLFDPVTFTVSTNATSGINPAPPPPPVTNPYTAAFTGNTANILNTDLQMALSVNNVVINTTGSGAGTGDIDIQASVTWSTANTLTMIGRSVTVDSGVTVSNSSASGAFTAINFQGNSPNVFTGSFTGITIEGTLSTVSGSISLVGNAGNSGINSGVSIADTALIEASGIGGVSITGTSTTGGGVTVSSLGGETITTNSGNITITGTSSTGVALTLEGMAGGTVTLTGDSITLNADITAASTILVQPLTPSLAIFLGNPGVGLSLNSGQLAFLQPTSTLTIGRANGTHDITLDNVALTSNTIARGTDITIGATGIANANGKTITFDVGITQEGTFTKNGSLVNGTFIANSFAFGGIFNITDSVGLVAVNGSLSSGAILDYTGYPAAVVVDLGTETATGVSSFSNLTDFTGTNSNSTLIGPNTSNTWSFSGENQGAIIGFVTFTNFDNLTGGSVSDEFRFNGGLSLNVSGFIDGGSGSNTFNYFLYSTPVVVNIVSGIATGVGSFSNIQNFIGGSSSSNMLTGPNTPNTWNITGSNAGNINSSAFTFSSFQNLTGGTMDDSFAFSNGTSVGVIDGGLGSNTLNYALYTTAVVVNIQSGTATGAASFANIQNFIGGTAAGTLTGPNTPNTWNITDNNAGNINSSAFTFSSFGNLIGNSMNDDFVFMNGVAVTGTINGGLGTNTLDYHLYATPIAVKIGALTATATGGFSNIQNFIGGMATDTLTGPNTANTWAITGNNAGNINSSAFTFSSFENLIGGLVSDQFVFSNGVGVSGSINEGGGVGTLDYHLYTSDVFVNITAQTATGTGGMVVVRNAIGGSGNNTLTGPTLANNIWSIMSSNAGNVDGFVFTAFGNLTGTARKDSFVFTNGASVTGIINGGGGTNTLDYHLYSTPILVDIGAGMATATGGFSNIQTIIGGGGQRYFSRAEYGEYLENHGQ